MAKSRGIRNETEDEHWKVGKDLERLDRRWLRPFGSPGGDE